MIEKSDSDPQAVKSRARKMLMNVHTDRFANSPELIKPASTLVSLLQEISAFPDDPDNWQASTEETMPLGTEITLIGEAPDGTIRPPLVVPLRRPEVFLKMLETYLATGSVPADLIADDSEASDEETIAHREVDEASKMFLQHIERASTLDHVLGIQFASRVHSMAGLRKSGEGRDS
jgi:hypothetical protein